MVVDASTILEFRRRSCKQLSSLERRAYFHALALGNKLFFGFGQAFAKSLIREHGLSRA